MILSALFAHIGFFQNPVFAQSLAPELKCVSATKTIYVGTLGITKDLYIQAFSKNASETDWVQIRFDKVIKRDTALVMETFIASGAKLKVYESGDGLVGEGPLKGDFEYSQLGGKLNRIKNLSCVYLTH